MVDNSKLQLILKEGESDSVEFKERLSNLDREIVAFANARGGSIYIGVTDDGEVIGVETNNRISSQIQDIARNCDPSIKIQIIAHKKLNILEVVVEEGTDKPYRCKDGFFLRTGPSSQKLRRDEIVQFINESGKVQFDRVINEKFDYPADFSKPALDEYLNLCGVSTRASEKDILLSLGVAEENRKKFLMTNAGVLFFAKDPQKYFPEASMKTSS